MIMMIMITQPYLYILTIYKIYSYLIYPQYIFIWDNWAFIFFVFITSRKIRLNFTSTMKDKRKKDWMRFAFFFQIFCLTFLLSMYAFYKIYIYTQIIMGSKQKPYTCEVLLFLTYSSRLKSQLNFSLLEATPFYLITKISAQWRKVSEKIIISIQLRLMKSYWIVAIQENLKLKK